MTTLYKRIRVRSRSDTLRLITVLRIWIRNPVPFLTPGARMGKKSGTGSGMNKMDHIPIRELRKNFWVKILKFFDADPGWKKFGSGIRIRNQHPGSYFCELRNKFFGLNYLNSLMQIRIRESFLPWIQVGKNSDLGSGINISRPQHCIK